MTQFASGDAARSPQKSPQKSPQDSLQDSPKLSPRERANQKRQLRKQQEKLLSDLLTVVDLLDRATDHWHQAELNHTQKQAKPQATRPRAWWQSLRAWFGPKASPPSALDPLAEVVTSAREGIDMIRESMLDVLSQHDVVPLPAEGKPFDPEQMHALGQQADANVPPNTVVQEVVRGYQWKDRILREAQVMVAGSSTQEEEISS